jgi:hypothetical protein
MSINVDKDNKRYTSIDGVLFESSPYFTLIRYPQGKQGAYMVPNGFIREYAFSGCTGLTSVILPDGIKKIIKETFYGCTNLTSIILPSSLEYIGKDAFAVCKSLTSITIPRHVKYIDKSAFGHCFSLTSINVDKKNSEYTSIDGVLFRKEIEGLVSWKKKKWLVLVQYPLGKQGTSYTVPNGVGVIGEFAIAPCTNLTSITIPSSVWKIERKAFTLWSRNMTSLIVRSWTPPRVDRRDNGFQGISDSVCLYVPAGRVGAYRRADGWKNFKCIKPTYSRKRIKNE